MLSNTAIPKWDIASGASLNNAVRGGINRTAATIKRDVKNASKRYLLEKGLIVNREWEVRTLKEWKSWETASTVKAIVCP